MKKQAPLVLGMLVGFFALAEFYIPWYVVGEIQERLLGYAQILAAAAFVLGGINVVQVNWPKIRRREADWPFKVVLLGSAALMGVVGVKWHELGGEAQKSTVSIQQAAGDTGGKAVIRVTASQDDAIVKIDGRAVPSPVEVAVEPGPHTVQVRMLQSGYGEHSEELTVTAGQVAMVHAELPMLWGPQGRAYVWIYDYVFYPCNATMFALLAFYIASAAFRAFRARNTEAALLLGAAIIIMLGRAPIGRAISDILPEISDWILEVPNNAGRRAIMMGAALGAIATGLRVILGLERSHLGAGD